jgi:hypothetical protein
MWITRKYIQEHPETIFVFGDNMQETGLGGQALEARGEKNAIGIPTKWAPNNQPSSFFKDEDYHRVVPHINEIFRKLKYEKDTNGFSIVFFPGIGEGLADLPRRAPTIYKYIKEMIDNF